MRFIKTKMMTSAGLGSLGIVANKPYSKGLYTITGPTGREFSPPAGRYWRVSEEKLREFDEDGRIWWGPTGEARPSIKRYLNEVADLVPRTLWSKDAVGSNRSSKNEQRAIFAGAASFDTPKPNALIERGSGSDCKLFRTISFWIPSRAQEQPDMQC